MQWHVLSPSKFCMVLVLAVHGVGFGLSITLVWPFVVLGLIFVACSLGYNLYRWVFLHGTQAVLSIRIQSGVWQIKTRAGWQEVILDQLVQLGVVFFYFKAQDKDYVAMLCKDSTPEFRQLMASATLALH